LPGAASFAPAFVAVIKASAANAPIISFIALSSCGQNHQNVHATVLSPAGISAAFASLCPASSLVGSFQSGRMK
jgi:hypothetical protein